MKENKEGSRPDQKPDQKQDLETPQLQHLVKEDIVIFYTNAQDLSSIQHMEDSQYLIEDLQDHEEQA